MCVLLCQNILFLRRPIFGLSKSSRANSGSTNFWIGTLCRSKLKAKDQSSSRSLAMKKSNCVPGLGRTDACALTSAISQNGERLGTLFRYRSPPLQLLRSNTRLSCKLSFCQGPTIFIIGRMRAIIWARSFAFSGLADVRSSQIGSEYLGQDSHLRVLREAPNSFSLHYSPHRPLQAEA